MFREEGITIVSIITALGMTIGVIVEGILSATKSVVKPTPGPKPKPDPKPPKPKPDPKPPKPEPGWLKNISNLLLKIADEMLIDLPGIIGSVVSFVLKTFSSALGVFFSRTCMDCSCCCCWNFIHLLSSKFN